MSAKSEEKGGVSAERMGGMNREPQKVQVDGQQAFAYELDETGRWVTCRFVGYGKFFIEKVENVSGLNLETLPKVT